MTRRTLFLSLFALMLLAACTPAENIPTPTSTLQASPTPAPTETVEPTQTPEPTATTEPTASPTDPPTATSPPPTEAPTATPPPTVSPDLNWLVNGDFANGSFAGWNQENGYWTAPPAALHGPQPCSESGTWYLQMDRDQRDNGWPPPPSEDRAWQDVNAPGPHSALLLHYEEAHHMHTGIIQITIYGRSGGSDDWEMVFQQVGAQSPYGTGKCGQFGPPAVYDYVIDLEQPYDQYRVEIYGKIVHPKDGVLWGDFRLSGV
ncbi:MAG: hypothetical protein R3335_05870 [Anaerolineales bacterium]|nr:hypothetical protein [Anaerolineales bacterium]